MSSEGGGGQWAAQKEGERTHSPVTIWHGDIAKIGCPRRRWLCCDRMNVIVNFSGVKVRTLDVAAVGFWWCGAKVVREWVRCIFFESMTLI